jgi:hypothetical protein
VCTKCYDVSNLIKKSSGNSSDFSDDTLDAPDSEGLGTRVGPGTRFDFGNGNNSFHINNLNGKISPSQDIGEFMTAKGYSLPNDTVNFQDYQTLLYAITILRPDNAYRAGNVAWEDTIVTGTECALYMCVNAYNSSMINGHLEETAVATWAERASLSWLPEGVQPAGVNISNTSSTTLGTKEWSPIGLDSAGNYVSRTDFQLMIPDADARRLNMSQMSFNATQTFLGSTSQYLSSLLPSNASSGNDSRIMGQVYSRKGGIQYSDPIMQPLYESPDLNGTFEQLALSMTNRFRTSSTNITQGTLQQLTTIVHIRWGFLILPLGVVVGGCIFMFASMIETRRLKIQPWKSSELASLVYGLNDRTRLQLRRACAGADMDKEAVRIRVQLLDSPNGMELR